MAVGRTLTLALTVGLTAGAIALVALALTNVEEAFQTTRDVRTADEIAMTHALNPSGRRVLETGASKRCVVGGVTINGMESSVTGDPDAMSCVVSRFMLKPLEDPASVRAGKGRARQGQSKSMGEIGPEQLEGMLVGGAALSAYCRPDSTLCTVTFDRGAPPDALKAYNTMLKDAFGIGALQPSQVTHTGVQYALLPDGPGRGSAPKRVHVRVEADGSKSFLAYKFVRSCPESPLELWTSGGRNVDADAALDPDSDALPYASDILREGPWEAFPFSHVIVEARAGARTVARLRFRASKDRMAWFHPEMLTEARFGDSAADSAGSGGSADSGDFAKMAFRSFHIAREGSRLFWCIMADADDPKDCKAQRFYLCVPYRDTSCTDLERLHARVLAADGSDPVAAAGYKAESTTHLVVWLSARGWAKSDEAPMQFDGSKADGAVRLPSLVDQGVPKNVFVTTAQVPTKQSPVMLGNRCGTASPGWQTLLSEGEGAYSAARLEALLGAIRKGPIAAMVDASVPTLYTLDRLRVHKAFRVVLFGEGRDFSPDAMYVAVLHDPKVLATYGIAPPTAGKTWSNVRYADGRVATIACNDRGDDNDGSFVEACLGEAFTGSARSLIVEKATVVPVYASQKCGSQAFETVLHVGSYAGKSSKSSSTSSSTSSSSSSSSSSSTTFSDMVGNDFQPDKLRSFKVDVNYSLVLFPQPSFGGNAVTVRGPASKCMDDLAPPVASMRVLYTPRS